VKGEDAHPPRYGPGRAPVWLVRWRDGGGKQRLKTLHSEKKANRFKAQKELETEAEVTADQPDIRLVAFAERWLKTVDVEPKTRRGYEQIWKRYIKPEFRPTMKVRKVHRGHVKALLDKHRAEG
jgi:hypothetical protein